MTNANPWINKRQNHLSNKGEGFNTYQSFPSNEAVESLDTNVERNEDSCLCRKAFEINTGSMKKGLNLPLDQCQVVENLECIKHDIDEPNEVMDLPKSGSIQIEDNMKRSKDTSAYDKLVAKITTLMESEYIKQKLGPLSNMTSTNSYKHDSKFTPHASSTTSLTLAAASTLNPITSSRMPNVIESTNKQNMCSSTHVDCYHESNKKVSPPPNAAFSDKILAKSADFGNGRKRKISLEEHIQENKITYADNCDKRKLILECEAIIGAKPSTTTQEPLIIEAVEDTRDHELQRNEACSTAPNVALNIVPPSAASGNVNSSVLDHRLSNVTPSVNIPTSSQDSKWLRSFSKCAVASKSRTKSAPITKIQWHKKHLFQSSPYTASNISHTETPCSKRTCLENSDAKWPVSHDQELIQDNETTSSISTRNVTSESSNHLEGEKTANVKRPCKKTASKRDVLKLLLEWKYQWLDIQMATQLCPPVCDQYSEVKDIYDSVGDYYKTYFPLYMVNIWLEIYNSWLERHYPVFDVKLDSCEEKYFVKYSGSISMKSYEFKQFLKREDFVCVKFRLDGREDALFGYIYTVEETEATTWKSAGRIEVYFSFYTAIKLCIPLGRTVKVQKLGNLRVLMKQYDTLRSLKESPFREIILKPIENESKIYLITLPLNHLQVLRFMWIIADLVNIQNRITLIDARPSIDRTSFISSLVKRLIERDSRVLVCLKDRRTLIELSRTILEYIKGKRFVIALKSSEISLPDFLARHTLRKQIKVKGKMPNKSEANLLCAQILKESDVILTVLSSIYFKEGKVASTKSGLKCIIDDSSLCTEPETILPLYYSVEHLMLIGDAQKETPMHPQMRQYGYHKSLYSRLYKAKKIL